MAEGTAHGDHRRVHGCEGGVESQLGAPHFAVLFRAVRLHPPGGTRTRHAGRPLGASVQALLEERIHRAWEPAPHPGGGLDRRAAPEAGDLLPAERAGFLTLCSQVSSAVWKREWKRGCCSLGALAHRLDSGILPFRKATIWHIRVSGGEFNVAANLADCFRLKTAMLDSPRRQRHGADDNDRGGDRGEGLILRPHHALHAKHKVFAGRGEQG